jgi:uncharacterized protein YcfL
MKTHQPFLFAVVLASLLLAGCAAERGPRLAAESTKYSIESTGKFALLDEATQQAVTCTGLQEHFTAAGLLEVTVNVKNRASRPLVVEVRCVFKDDNGFSTGDETPWNAVSLGEDATEAVHYTAVNRLARKYTVIVRGAR